MKTYEHLKAVAKALRVDFGGDSGVGFNCESMNVEISHVLETAQGYVISTRIVWGNQIFVSSCIRNTKLDIKVEKHFNSEDDLFENLGQLYQDLVKKYNFVLGRETPKTESERACEQLISQRILWDKYRDGFVKEYNEHFSPNYEVSEDERNLDGSFIKANVQHMFEFYIKGVLSMTENTPPETAQNAPLVPYYISADTTLADFLQQVRYAAETGQFPLHLIDTFDFASENGNFVTYANQVEAEQTGGHRTFIGASYGIQLTFKPFNMKIEARAGRSTSRNRSQCYSYLTEAMNVCREVWNAHKGASE